MKQDLLPLVGGVALAVAGVTGGAQALADEGPRIYGKLIVSYQWDEVEAGGVDVDQVAVHSHSSRFGVKGSQALNENLSAIYQIERGLNIDGEGADTWSERDTFVGLKCDRMGTVRLGKIDSPLKSAQGKVDQFGDIESSIGGGVKLDIDGVFTNAENRLDDVLYYTSPDLGPIKLNVALQPGESAGTEDGPADGVSASAVYQQDMIYAAIAYDSDIGNMDTIRLVGQLNMGDLTVGGMFEQTETSNGAKIFNGGTDDSADGLMISGSYSIGDTKLKAQFISSDIVSEGGQQVSLGVEQMLAKSTIVQAYFGTAEDDADNKSDTLGVGIVHSF